MSVRFEFHGVMKHSSLKRAASYLQKLLWQRKRIIESTVSVKPRDASRVYVTSCKCKHDSCRGCQGSAYRLYQKQGVGEALRWRCDLCRHTFREGDRRRRGGKGRGRKGK